MEWIKEQIRKLYKKFNTTNPYELASLLNINVITFDLHKEINGYYKYDRRNKYIVINNNLSNELQRVVCAHELGHATLHPRYNTPFMRQNTFFSIDRIEVEANDFATQLLLFNQDFENHQTKIDILRENGIPYEMERFIY